MSGDEWFERHLGRVRAMVILRGFTPERTVQLASLAWRSGIRAVEVPVQSPQSLAALEAVAEAAHASGALVGAGTILTAAQVDEVRRAGAAFTVSPGFDAEVSRASRDALLPLL
ncbi:MAG: 2-dehydro-3-deoxyphosphogluconate aldolase, partial [Gemmatimonadales bacterium]